MEIPKSAFQKCFEDWQNAGISVLYLRGVNLKGTRQLLINKYLLEKFKITVIFLALLARPCRSYRGGCSGETGI